MSIDTIVRETEGEAAGRAVYVTTNANTFDDKLPDVPAHVFVAEAQIAFDPATGTSLIPLDLSGRLRTAYVATTPNLMSRYARVGAGEELRFSLTASGEVYYAMTGGGMASKGSERIAWRAGDAFCLPGGGETVLTAKSADCVLWQITDEPVLAHLGARSPAVSAGRAVHYPGAEMRRHLDAVHARGEDKTTGKAVLLTSAPLSATTTTTATIGLAMNSLEPGGDQLPHRHNAVALTLCVQGDGVYSLIDGERTDWRANAVMVTPPTRLHSHHNRGTETMLSMVAQDGGFFYNARAIGFSWS